MSISTIIFFLMHTDLVKTSNFFLFYDLPACNEKAEMLLLATALITHLRNQFKSAKSVAKNCKISERWGLRL